MPTSRELTVHRFVRIAVLADRTERDPKTVGGTWMVNQI